MDLNQRQLDELLYKLGQVVRVVGANTDGDRAAAKARTAATSSLTTLTSKHSKLGQALDRLHGHTQKLTGSFDDMLQGVKRGIEVFAGGALIGSLIHNLEGMVSTYRELTEVGQTFGGSIIGMSKAAADAGMPLGQFAKMLEKNSVVAAYLQTRVKSGGDSLAQMSKAVRANMESVGFYGMTLDQVNALTGDYAETLRLQGRLSTMSASTMGREVNSFAEQVSQSSMLFGKARQEIIDTVMSVDRDWSVTSRALTDGQRTSLNSFTAFLAGLPGEAGKILPELLGQTVGMGNELFAKHADLFFSTGTTGLLNVVTRMAGQVQAGGKLTAEGQIRFAKEFAAEGARVTGALRLQALAGSAEAQQLLNMIAQVRSFSETDPKELERRQKFSNFLLSLENIWNKLTGAFKGGFLEALENWENQLNKLGGNNSVLDTIGKVLYNIGKALGNAFATIFQPANLQAIGQVLMDFGTGLGKFISGVFTPPNIHAFEEGAKQFFAGLKVIGHWVWVLVSNFGRIADAAGVVAAALAGLFTIVSRVDHVLRRLFAWIGGWFTDKDNAKKTGGAVADAMLGLVLLAPFSKLVRAVLLLPFTLSKLMLSGFGKLLRAVLSPFATLFGVSLFGKGVNTAAAVAAGAGAGLGGGGGAGHTRGGRVRRSLSKIKGRRFGGIAKVAAGILAITGLEELGEHIGAGSDRDDEAADKEMAAAIEAATTTPTDLMHAGWAPPGTVRPGQPAAAKPAAAGHPAAADKATHPANAAPTKLEHAVGTGWNIQTWLELGGLLPGTVGKVASRGAGALAGPLGAVSAYVDYKRGDKVGAGLDAAIATTGTAGLFFPPAAIASAALVATAIVRDVVGHDAFDQFFNRPAGHAGLPSFLRDAEHGPMMPETMQYREEFGELRHHWHPLDGFALPADDGHNGTLRDAYQATQRQLDKLTEPLRHHQPVDYETMQRIEKLIDAMVHIMAALKQQSGNDAKKLQHTISKDASSYQGA